MENLGADPFLPRTNFLLDFIINDKAFQLNANRGYYVCVCVCVCVGDGGRGPKWSSLVLLT